MTCACNPSLSTYCRRARRLNEARFRAEVSGHDMEASSLQDTLNAHLRRAVQRATTAKV